jgi:hypothetical protein
MFIAIASLERKLLPRAVQSPSLRVSSNTAGFLC